MAAVKRTTILAGLGVLLIGSLLLLLRRSSPTGEPGRVAQAPQSPLETSPTPPGVSPELAAEAPLLRQAEPPRAAPATTPPPPEPQGLEDGGAPGHPVGDFGWKYAHASAEERRSAQRALQRDYERELTRAFERRVRAGQFREAACDGLDVGALLQELEAGGLLHAVVTVPGDRPVRSADDAEGATSLRWIQIERFDEGKLHELAGELDWLRRAGL